MKKGYGKMYGGICNKVKGGLTRGRGEEANTDKVKASPQPNYKDGKHGKN